MLHLAEETDSGWFDRVKDHIPMIMVDHAHLEKRAASNAMNMVFRYASKIELVRELSQVVSEEIEHFRQVLDLLDARGVAFQKLTAGPYASQLVSAMSVQEPQALMDKLIASAFIEARSCERFQILATHVEDSELADFYADLAEQEARHHVLYTQLARQYFDKEKVAARIKEVAIVEQEAVSSSSEPRLHSF